MDKADPSNPILTENDKQVLKKIILHAKTPDSEIASSMTISPQAVFKIRNKLEKLGIIKGYVPMIDFHKIGIDILVMLVIRLTPLAWERHSDISITNHIALNPHVIEAYRVSDVRASHILLLGFRNVEKKEKFIQSLQTKYSKEIDIKDVYTFSVANIIVNNPLGILGEIIDKTDYVEHDFFPKD